MLVQLVRDGDLKLERAAEKAKMTIEQFEKAIRGYIRDWGEYDLNYYFCDACRYCFSAENLPDRCPDFGAQIYKERPAVRLACKNEIEELLRIRAEDNN